MRSLLAFLIVLGAGASAHAATVGGTLAEPSIVWISDGNSPKPVDVEMRNREKSFQPDFLIVPVGSSVRFPNEDAFFHSIYSPSQVNAFDIGFYATGPGKSVLFEHSGVAVVKCHIHAKMYAVIAAVDGPSQNAGGETFALHNVRPGRHVVHAWSQGAGDRSRTIRVPAGEGAVTVEKL